MAGRTAKWVVVKLAGGKAVIFHRDSARNLPSSVEYVSSHRDRWNAVDAVKRLEAKNGS